jgi:dihydrofolate reductase
MRNLASFIIVSLDGFHEDANGVFDFAIVDEEFRQFAIRQLDEAETLGFGRTTYQHMADFWPTDQARAIDEAIATRMNDKPKLVFSNTLEHAAWSNTSIIAGNVIERIEELKSTPGAEVLIIGSAHLTASFIAADVLDELRIMVSPIVLGQGHALFADLKERLALTLTDVRQFESGNVLLTYRKAKDVHQ